jgi:hypothetical protein
MMKQLFSLLGVMLAGLMVTFAQENIPSAKVGVTYGKSLSKDGAINVKQLQTKFGPDSTYNGKIEGEVVEVCKKKGCFIRIKRAGDGEAILVRFKDYGFFMPQDIVGKTIVLEGQAKIKETSVAWLKHYAEDAGKSAEEIAKITQPKVDINIIADGVVVVK